MEETQTRGRVRSPNYPVFGLATALERADALYKRDGKAPVRIEAAVRAWGYNSINGRSLGVLAALRQFGLIEEAGTTKRLVRLSQSALTLLLTPPDEPEHRKALAEAARRPKIFADLIQQYGEGGYPSVDTMVRNLTLSTTFSGEGAARVIAAFRETIELLMSRGVSHTSQDMADESEEKGDDAGQFPDQKPKTKERSMPAIESAGQAPPYDLMLALIDGENAVLRIPRHMSEDNYKLLVSLLDANLKAMKSALVRPTQGES